MSPAASPSPPPIPTPGAGLKLPPPIEVPDSLPSPEEMKGPEIERSLDRAKENLLAYIEERHPDCDTALLRKAVDFTVLAHKDQFRHSGMPYAEHPFEVAKLLADFNMDTVTIVAGLLHDVAEDTLHGVTEIREEFGEEVAFLVEAVTKITALGSRSRVEQQAETFRKMLVSMAKDLRVIMIKFADRLHNMRTLSYHRNEEKRRAIAAETLEVYAPLAHRFGLGQVKWELEDLSFKYLKPDAYKSLVHKVVEKRLEREEYVRSILGPAKEALAKAGLEAQVFGRPKHLYSIYSKMQSRNCQFEDIYDLHALRIIVKTVGDCYAVLGAMHALWSPLQSRFKDYIATPKSNHYQSLHTTVIGPGGKAIEVQIRTHEMDLVAEQGIAAHWGYKEGSSSREIGKENTWLKQVVEWQKDLTDSEEFMEYFRRDLAPSEIFVNTPKGQIIQLPQGATALDFAFALHSELGLHCVGARVDGVMVPLHRPLQSNERVEILKSDSQHPSQDWLSIVVTTKAKHHIRRWLRTEESAHSIQLGKEMMEREFRQARVASEHQADLAPFTAKFGVQNWETLWEKLGHGELSLGAVSAVVQELSPMRPKPSMLSRIGIRRPSKPVVDSVLVSGLGNMLIRFATCCHPVPGDRIIGYVTRGRGVSVHRANCPEGLNLTRDKERIVPVQWSVDAGQTFDAHLEITAKDRSGLLRDLTDVFSKVGVNVERASIVTLRDQVRNRFRVQVRDLDQIEETMERLRKVPSVYAVSRRTSGA
ncbi:MAG: bifunctional (p)ppGpp synthetase/guanosine-3,5-bis(diphosphate) 3-pyrophosphohydrolase [Fibrobacteria bacterium]|nr:bifunctional (p)ppGpp synthetase/guanosine-3,5-bis(diphosphate) 3-pyrophosphohydrolase [Fibrobacteria bacterium]